MRSITARRAGAALVAAAACAGAVLAGPPAVAQAPETPTVALRRVDSTNPEEVVVAFRYDGDPADVGGVELVENGRAVRLIDSDKSDLDPDSRTDKSDVNLTYSLVFVFDTSASTGASGVLDASRDAARGLIASRELEQEMAVVAAGFDSTLVQRFTDDEDAVEAAIDGLTPAGDGALWSGIARGAGLYERRPDHLPTIVVFSDGNADDNESFAEAAAAVQDSGAQVFAVGVAGEGGDLAGLRQLADRSGGRYVEAESAFGVAAALDDITALINGDWAVVYESAVRRGVIDLTVTVGDASTTGSYVTGSVATGAAELQPLDEPGAGGIRWLQGGLARTVALIIAAGAVLVGAYAVLAMVVRDESQVASAIQPYATGVVRTAGEGDTGSATMARTALVRRAVRLTERLALRQGRLAKVEDALERANLPLRAGEAMFFYGALAVLATVAVALLTANALAVVLVLVLFLLLPPATLSFLTSRRIKQFESQLPDSLQLLAGTLRAGFSLLQGVETVSREVPDPMGRELGRAVTEARLGRPLEDSLAAIAERMGSGDFAWAVMAIRIQREVGGNLSELLVMVSDTMTQRERLRREVRALTGESRLSAVILGVLPIGLALVISVINPGYLARLVDEPVGNAMLIGGTALAVLGFWWMSRIVRIEV